MKYRNNVLGGLMACLLLMTTSCNEGGGDDYDFNKQLTEDIATIDKYIVDHFVPAFKFSNGIRIEILSLGNLGLPPKLEHTVQVKYTARLLGSNSIVEQNTVERTLSASIDGWKLAFPLLPEGTRANVYVPSGYAFGNEAVNSIPANAILVYDVEILKVTLPTSEASQLESDVDAIDDYLTDHEITATTDESGIRYSITEPGSDNKPDWYDKIKVKYTAKVLGSGSTFFNGTLQPTETFDSYVVDYLLGLQVGFQKLGEGGKATIYVPSPLGFGNKVVGGGAVPANSILVYEVELLDVL